MKVEISLCDMKSPREEVKRWTVKLDVSKVYGLEREEAVDEAVKRVCNRVLSGCTESKMDDYNYWEFALKVSTDTHSSCISGYIPSVEDLEDRTGLVLSLIDKEESLSKLSMFS